MIDLCVAAGAAAALAWIALRSPPLALALAGAGALAWHLLRRPTPRPWRAVDRLEPPLAQDARPRWGETRLHRHGDTLALLRDDRAQLWPDAELVGLTVTALHVVLHDRQGRALRVRRDTTTEAVAVALADRLADATADRIAAGGRAVFPASRWLALGAAAFAGLAALGLWQTRATTGAWTLQLPVALCWFAAVPAALAHDILVDADGVGYPWWRWPWRGVRGVVRRPEANAVQDLVIDVDTWYPPTHPRTARDSWVLERLIERLTKRLSDDEPAR